MNKKGLMAAGALAVTIALSVGVSYAWFTSEANANVTGVEAGYLKISLDSDPDDTDLIFPADQGKEITYTIMNKSSRGRAVYARFSAGDLTAYKMKSKHLYDEDGKLYVQEDSRSLLDVGVDKKTDPDGEFEPTVNAQLDDTNVMFGGITDIEASTGSEYIGVLNGNYYFRLAENGTATFKFHVGLTESAGNDYQYALFQMEQATALATQDNLAAFENTFGCTIDGSGKITAIPAQP